MIIVYCIFDTSNWAHICHHSHDIIAIQFLIRTSSLRLIRFVDDFTCFFWWQIHDFCVSIWLPTGDADELFVYQQTLCFCWLCHFELQLDCLCFFFVVLSLRFTYKIEWKTSDSCRRCSLNLARRTFVHKCTQTGICWYLLWLRLAGWWACVDERERAT